MNKDELKGKSENLKGRLKEAAGIVADDAQLEKEGADEREIGEAREQLGCDERTVEQLGAAFCLNGSNELLALLVLIELRLEAEQSLQHLGHRIALLATLAQHATEAFRARDATCAGAIHRDVAVPLEQAHHPADLLEQLALLGRGEQRHESTVFQRAAPLA